ncbi:RING finger protein 112-like [Xenopus tropicalis]|uniref:RING finger protein 112-like n=1 Tax=Xenopus tropicalis TaxID=8364 RepID=A0A8J1IXJ6_XENTR|nr:RING finger protein 112-like [Xenopus tropicalis]
MQGEGPTSFQSLEEEILCSICYNELDDLVSIGCGHTFCRECITTYWGTSQQCLCPECRTVCPEDQLIPVHRLKSLITKIQQEVKGEQTKKRTSIVGYQEDIASPSERTSIEGYQEDIASPPNRTSIEGYQEDIASPPERTSIEGYQEDTLESSVCAIQLVSPDEFGHLRVNKDAVQTCFMNSVVMDYPVCLICVIGERQGKSSLINLILRALSCQEKGQPLSLGPGNETRMEWKVGINNMAKGIWMWSKPFILEHYGEKMAVFVLDTEDSLDLNSSSDIGIRLSAISAVLSSYLIFNVDSDLKITTLDYFKMYFRVTKCVEESFDLQPFQHVDIIRCDGEELKTCGKEDLLNFIIRESQRLPNPSLYKLVSDTLTGPLADCSYLPHPGQRLLNPSRRRSSDMEEDSSILFTTYIFNLVRDIWLHKKLDKTGGKVTGAQLARTLKSVVNILQTAKQQFPSPLQMFFQFKNHKNMEKLKEQFHSFIHKMREETDHLIKVRNLRPTRMESNINDIVTCFMSEFIESLKGDDIQEKERLNNELESYLLQHQQEFCEDYAKKFYKFHNHKITVNTKQTFLGKIFLEESRMIFHIRNHVEPHMIENKMHNVVSEFVAIYSESLEGLGDQKKQLRVKKMKSYFLSKKEEFCMEYSKKYYALENKKNMKIIKKDFQDSLKELEKETSTCLLKNLMMTPDKMESQISNTIPRYIFAFQNSLEGVDNQEQEILVNYLEVYFTQQQEAFCEDYQTIS